MESVGAAPSAAAGRESIVYKVTALPEQAETALEAAFETALAPKLTNYIVHDLEAAVKQDLDAFAADAKAQLTEVRTTHLPANASSLAQKLKVARKQARSGERVCV